METTARPIHPMVLFRDSLPSLGSRKQWQGMVKGTALAVLVAMGQKDQELPKKGAALIIAHPGKEVTRFTLAPTECRNDSGARLYLMETFVTA